MPTVAESGGPAGYDADFWDALVAPCGTPGAVIQRLDGSIAAALRTKDVQQKFANIGFEPVSSTPRRWPRWSVPI